MAGVFSPPKVAHLVFGPHDPLSKLFNKAEVFIETQTKDGF